MAHSTRVNELFKSFGPITKTGNYDTSSVCFTNFSLCYNLAYGLQERHDHIGQKRESHTRRKSVDTSNPASVPSPFDFTFYDISLYNSVGHRREQSREIIIQPENANEGKERNRFKLKLFRSYAKQSQ